MFQNQITWIRENQEANNIRYVAHLGDLVDHGEQKMHEWERASQIMYQLEEPTAGFPQGIPYGIAVGNHDQQPLGNPASGVLKMATPIISEKTVLRNVITSATPIPAPGMSKTTMTITMIYSLSMVKISW